MRRPRPRELEFTLRFEFPVILDESKPSVTLHKNGKYLLIKANDPIATDTLREVIARMECEWMKFPAYYNAEGAPVEDYRKIELWRNLKGNINDHPFCTLLKAYGVEVGTAPTLEGYIRKEYRRRVLEDTPHPAPPVTNDDNVSLFDRCLVGTPLLCIQDYFTVDNHEHIFKKGERYLVTGGGDSEGCDQVQICRTPITRGATLNMAIKGLNQTWTELDPPMEAWFDDSENIDFGETIDQKYPERVKAMTARMAKLDFISKAVDAGEKNPLYEHVRVDAVLEALRRGVVNCKLMRMGKSSESIVICELWGSQKVAIIGSKNVRLAYRREFRRLGMQNFVFVNKFSDLDKEGKYYLFTYDWLKLARDPEAAARKEFDSYLRKSERVHRRKVAWNSEASQAIVVYQHNPCPHCGEPMERPLLGHGVTLRASWTTDRGYLCRNTNCAWESDNRIQSFKRIRVIHNEQSHAGAAWASDQIVMHRAGTYVDTDLARHARCSGTEVRGRMCHECGAMDGVWIPPKYKRVKDRFTAVVGDEVHNCKAINSENAQALYAFRARHRIAQTGTLLSNAPTDAYWPLSWAINAPSSSFPWRWKQGQKEFEKRFCEFIYLEKPTGEIDEETGLEITKTIRKRTPFLINPPDWWRTMQRIIVRRSYGDPLFQKSLIEAGMIQPKVNIQRVTVPMHPEQVRLMLAALRDFRVQFERMVEEAEVAGKEVNKALVISKMSVLRSLATSPERINRQQGAEIYKGPPGGGKMAMIQQLVRDSVSMGKKVFLISDFVEMQCLLERELKRFNPIRLIPSWGDEKRAEAMELFANDSSRHGFIAGTRAVRESIDASAADITICPDMLWSPAFQCQAWSRTMAPTIRERTCDVYLMVSQHSLDEYIYDVFYSKMAGAEQALDRKIRSRRAKDFDVKVFARLVLQEEEALTLQLREGAGDPNLIFLPDASLEEERVA